MYGSQPGLSVLLPVLLISVTLGLAGTAANEQSPSEKPSQTNAKPAKPAVSGKDKGGDTPEVPGSGRKPDRLAAVLTKDLRSIKANVDKLTKQYDTLAEKQPALWETAEGLARQLDDLKAEVDELASHVKKLEDTKLDIDGGGQGTVFSDLDWDQLIGVGPWILAFSALLFAFWALVRSGRRRETPRDYGKQQNPQWPEERITTYIEKAVHSAMARYDVLPRSQEAEGNGSRASAVSSPEAKPPIVPEVTPDEESAVPWPAPVLIQALCKAVDEHGREDVTGEHYVVDLSFFAQIIKAHSIEDARKALGRINATVSAKGVIPELRDKILVNTSGNRGNLMTIKVSKGALKAVGEQDWR